MSYTYPKEHKLKSKKLIDSLFKNGKSVSKYPLRIVFIELPEEENYLHSFVGVSVSKKYFKNAVDRNTYKRRLRELYRLYQKELLKDSDKKFAMMFFYQTKDRLNYQEMQQKMIELIDKFHKNTTPSSEAN